MAAHSISNSRRRREAMNGTVADFQDWQFEVTCANCRETKIVELGALVPRYGEQRIAWAVGHLRCRLPGCGGRPSRVVLQRGEFGVILEGSGAYG